jgi:Fe-S cluster assembly protein SufD
MTAILESGKRYRTAFKAVERELAAEPVWLHRVRIEAFARFDQLGFPTTDDEEWRFTNVAPIARTQFALAVADEILHLPVAVPEFDAHRLVFVNGRYHPRLSNVGVLPPAVTVASLAGVLRTGSMQLEVHLARHAEYGDHAFAALNTAFFRDGAFVSIGRDQVIEKPIHLVFLATSADGPRMVHPRTLIVAAENSRATVVETYASIAGGPLLANAVTEVVVGRNASLDHCKLQRESIDAFHVGLMHVLQHRDSRCSLLTLALGGAIARNEVAIRFDDVRCECNLNGLTMAAGRQLIDHHTRIDHTKPHGRSRQLYKTVLDGQAHGVFNGKIYVHPDAQKTDAKQSNQTLLLSADAVIDTKPQLEIFADDVKCTHGATVGQLDVDALFYLRTRGIDQEAARTLLTHAFANEIVGRIPVESLRAQVESWLSGGAS